MCTAEGWPVALVCYHIARGFDRQVSFVEEVATGVGPQQHADGHLASIASALWIDRARDALWRHAARP